MGEVREGKKNGGYIWGGVHDASCRRKNACHHAGLTFVGANRTWTTPPAKCKKHPSSSPGPHPPCQRAHQEGSHSEWECQGCPAQLAHHPEISCLLHPGHSPHFESHQFPKCCQGSANPMKVSDWTNCPLPSTGDAGARQTAVAATSDHPPCTGFVPSSRRTEFKKL